MRVLLYSPKDTVAGLLASVAAGAVVTNALFMQAGPHPAPMFGATVVNLAATPPATSLLPRPRPTEADAAEVRETEKANEKNAESKSIEARSADARSDAMANLVKTTAPSQQPATTAALPSSSNGPRPPLSGARRVAAVQRALTEYGYGQLKPTGTIGADTQAAIQKFERERKLPVTGQVSDRLVRELGTVIGHPVE
jgi:Putative peptidoglycan binding domain